MSTLKPVAHSTGQRLPAGEVSQGRVLSRLLAPVHGEVHERYHRGGCQRAREVRSMLAPRRALADWLGDADEVALAVVEERADLPGALTRIVIGCGDHLAASLKARHLEAREG